MWISTKQLRQLLKIDSSLDTDPTDTPKNGLVTRYAKEGPAYLNPWLIMQGFDDPWAHISAVSAFTQKRRIIFSTPWIGKHALFEIEIALITALMRKRDQQDNHYHDNHNDADIKDNEYEVYLWRGNISFANLTPITSTEEFWEKREKIIGATSEHVKEMLSDQGVDPNVIVIDHAAYNKLLHDYYLLTKTFKVQALKYLGAHVLNLSYMPLEDKEVVKQIIAAVDVNSIKKIIIAAPSIEEIKTLLSLFPSLQQVEIALVSTSWIEKHIHFFAGKEIIFNTIYRPDKPGPIQLHFPQHLHFIGISIINSNNAIDDLYASFPYSLKNITLKDYTAQNINIGFSQTEKMKVINGDFGEVDFSRIHQLTSLELRDCKRLRKITFSNQNVRLKKLIISNCPSLTELEQLDQLDLTHLQLNIKNDKVDIAALFAFIKKQIHLKKLVLNLPTLSGAVKAYELDLSALSQLKKLKLTIPFLRELKGISYQVQWLSLELPVIEDISFVTFDETLKPFSQLVKCKFIVGSTENGSSLFLNKRGWIFLLTQCLQQAPLESLMLALENEDELQEIKNVIPVSVTQLHLKFIGKGPVFAFSTLQHLIYLESLTVENCTFVCEGKSPHRWLTECHFLNTFLFVDQSNLLQQTQNLTLNNSYFLRDRASHKVLLKAQDIIGLNLKYNSDPQDFLWLQGTAVERLVVSHCSREEIHWPQDNQIKSLIITDCVYLSATLDLSNLSKLEFLQTKNFSVTELTSSRLLPIKVMEIDNTPLLEMRWSFCPVVERFRWVNSQFLFTNQFRLELDSSLKLKELFVKHEPSDNHQSIQVNVVSPLLQELIIMTMGNCLLSFPRNNQLADLMISTQGVVSLPSSISNGVSLRSVFLEMNVGNDYHYYMKKFNSLANEKPLAIIIRDIHGGTRNPYSYYGAQPKNLAESQLGQANESHAVSLVSPYGKARVSTDTAPPKTAIQISDHYKLILFGNKNISKFNSHVDYLDGIKKTKTKGEIVFYQDLSNLIEIPLPLQTTLINKALIDQYQADIEKNEEERGGGYYVGPFSDKEKSFLPYKRPPLAGGIDILTEPANAITLFWDEKYHRYAFTKKKAVKTKMIQLLYRQKEQIGYELPAPSGSRFITQPDLLTPENYQIINRLLNPQLNPNSSLGFLFDATKDTEEKMACLIAYFKGPQFTSKPLINIPKNDIETLCYVALERSAKCAQKSESFQLTANFIGVWVQVACGEDHQFCRLGYYQAGSNEKEFHLLDLGGAPTLDLTDIKKRDAIFAHVPVAKSASPIVSSTATTATTTTIATTTTTTTTATTTTTTTNSVAVSPSSSTTIIAVPTIISPVSSAMITQAYGKTYDQVMDRGEIKSIAELLNATSPLPVLITLTAQQTPFTVNAAIIKQLKQVDKNTNTHTQHIYIHRPEDFDAFMWRRRYSRGEVIKEAKEKPTGHLKHIIKNGGVIVVNWSHPRFTPEQLLHVQSILEEQSHLLGEPIEGKVTIIGLATPAMQEKENTFLSRCSQAKLHADFFITVATDDDLLTQHVFVDVESEPLEIDFLHSPAWAEIMYGQCDPQYDAPHDGKLFAASLQQHQLMNKPIIIYNPPANDDNFELFVHQINDERNILINGEWYEVPAALRISTAQKAYPLLSEDNITITLDKNNDPFPARERIYLGLYNWHDCFKKFKIDNHTGKQLADTDLISQYSPHKDIFYITENIPLNYWQRLLIHIQENYPLKSIHFLIAPAVTIETIIKNDAIVMPPRILLPLTGSIDGLLQETIFTSNDPDCLSHVLTKKLSAHAPIIIEVNKTTQWSDLIYRVSIEAGRFYYEEKVLLSAWKNNQTVILKVNDDINKTFFSQLLPFLLGKKTLYCNGILTSLSGNVILVMPDAVRKNLPLLVGAKCHFTIDDYKNIFVHQAELDLRISVSRRAEIFNQIVHFFNDVVKAVPHQGMGYPAPPPLTYQRLHQLFFAIQSTKEKEFLYINNPIKSVFLFDYPRQSEAYAFLNIMAKYYFKSLPDQFNQQKFKKLTKLKNKIDVFDLNNIKEYQWRLLNCFPSAIRKQILGADIQTLLRDNVFPFLNEDQLQTLQYYVQHLQPMAVNQVVINSVEKRWQRLRELKENNRPLIILKGPSGTGKTYAVKQVIGECYEGTANIIAWLKNPAPTKPLFLSMTDIESASDLDFLKALAHRPGSVNFRGQPYMLTKHHQAIIKTYPETNVDDYHSLLQEYGETIYFEMPNKKYLTNVILKPLLQQYHLNDAFFIKTLITCFYAINQYNSLLQPSIRDLENLAVRFIALTLLANKPQGDHIKPILLRAGVSEFACRMRDAEQRSAYIAAIEKLIGVTPPAEEKKWIVLSKEKKYVLPKEKRYIVEAVEQYLLITRNILMKPEHANLAARFKWRLILEGPSGVGKTSFFKVMLERQMAFDMAAGLSQQEAQQKWGYLEVNASNAFSAEKIKMAEASQQFVILNEGNVGTKSALPLQLTVPILSSQNPSYLEGRHQLSRSTAYHAQIIYATTFTEYELKIIAQYSGMSPEFVEVYANKKSTDSIVNSRTFFETLKYVQQHPPAVIEQAKQEMCSLLKYVIFNPQQWVNNGNKKMVIVELQKIASADPDLYFKEVKKMAIFYLRLEANQYLYYGGNKLTLNEKKLFQAIKECHTMMDLKNSKEFNDILYKLDVNIVNRFMSR